MHAPVTDQESWDVAAVQELMKDPEKKARLLLQLHAALKQFMREESGASAHVVEE